MTGRTKLVKVELVVGENVSDCTLNANIRLNCDATKIFRVDARLENVRASVLTNQVLIEGTLHTQVFFVGEDDRVHHQGEDVPFSNIVSVPGANPARNMKAHVRFRTERTSFDLVGDRTVELQVVAQFFVKVIEDAQVNVFLSNAGPLLKADVVVGENTAIILPTQDIKLKRDAVKIREIRAEARDVKAEVLVDHVSIQGILHLQVFFVGDDQVVHHQAVDLPFTSVIDIPGAEEGMRAEVNVNVVRVERFIHSGGDKVQVRAVIQLFVKVTEDAQVCVEIFPGGPLVRTFRVVGERVEQCLIENRLRLSLPARKVQDIEARVVDLRTEVLNNRVVVNGKIHKQIFFVGPDEVLHHLPEDVPFTTVVDVPNAAPGMIANVNARVEHISWVLTNKDDEGHEHHDGDDEVFKILRQRIIVDLFVKVSEEAQINIRAVERTAIPAPGALGAFGGLPAGALPLGAIPTGISGLAGFPGTVPLAGGGGI